MIFFAATCSARGKRLTRLRLVPKKDLAFGKRLRWLPFFLLAICMFFGGHLPGVWGGIYYDGNIDPSDPTGWTDRTVGYVGKTGEGMLNVNGGSGLLSREGFLGYFHGSSGTVTVDETYSTWINDSICVGHSGSGILAIFNGGNASSRINRYIGYNSNSSGTVTVDGAGSTWTDNHYSCNLYVGHSGSGMLTITNGGYVSNYYAASKSYIGYSTGSSGKVVVDGALSTLNSGTLYVGYDGSGELTITNGGSISCPLWIGCEAGATGIVTVDGTGSQSINYSGNLVVGHYGNGTLNITNGGSLTTDEIYVGHYDGGTGKIDFGANGGTLKTRILISSPTQLMGTGTINTRGFVSDVDLAFDSIHGANLTTTLSGPGQNVTLNIDMRGASGGNWGDLGVGYKGTASLAIRDGVEIRSGAGYLGYNNGSSGTATVDGIGSSWKLGGNFYVGRYGDGTFTITNGGKVYDNNGTINCYIGTFSGSTGAVTVDGTGSMWTSSGRLQVGCSGTGTLNITNGGVFRNDIGGFIGEHPGSQGTVTVDGTCERLDCGWKIGYINNFVRRFTYFPPNQGEVSHGRLASSGGVRNGSIDRS